MKYFLIYLLFCTALFARNISWGWQPHQFINENAVDYLPPEMSFFQDHRDYLREHAVDPDFDPMPGYFHYIDIDYYPKFFNGTLTHNLDSLIARFHLSTVQNNGTVPWVVAEWTDSLTALMAANQWDAVWQVAAELGHYVADSHQPLHLTVNYNGQLTGNNGIHSRYETSMLNAHLFGLALPVGAGIYWPNVIDSVFAYIDEIYPFADNIMIADDLARAKDPAYTWTYYDLLWQELENLTTLSIQKAIIDLASIWRTAWENANCPSPMGVQVTGHHPQFCFLANTYPNPFNATTTIKFSIPEAGFVSVQIFNPLGQAVATLVNEKLPAGTYEYTWNAAGLASGNYLCRMATDAGVIQIRKLVLQK